MSHNGEGQKLIECVAGQDRTRLPRWWRAMRQLVWWWSCVHCRPGRWHCVDTVRTGVCTTKDELRFELGAARQQYCTCSRKHAFHIVAIKGFKRIALVTHSSTINIASPGTPEDQVPARVAQTPASSSAELYLIDAVLATLKCEV